ncbi:tyrosine- kinase receptor Tie-1-like, partial [Paramuricea clavata]
QNNHHFDHSNNSNPLLKTLLRTQQCLAKPELSLFSTKLTCKSLSCFILLDSISKLNKDFPSVSQFRRYKSIVIKEDIVISDDDDEPVCFGLEERFGMVHSNCYFYRAVGYVSLQSILFFFISITSFLFLVLLIVSYYHKTFCIFKLMFEPKNCFDPFFKLRKKLPPLAKIFWKNMAPGPRNSLIGPGYYVFKDMNFENKSTRFRVSSTTRSIRVDLESPDYKESRYILKILYRVSQKKRKLLKSLIVKFECPTKQLDFKYNRSSKIKLFSAEKLHVVIEFCPGGNLRNFLLNSRVYPSTENSSNYINMTSTLNHRQLLKIAVDISNGMAHISSQKFVHRDLAARNILIGEGNMAKVSDFGLARDISAAEEYIRNNQNLLPVKWMALENLLHGRFTTASDV